MASVSGPAAEIIRSDSGIIKERISTRLPRVASGKRLVPRFFVAGNPGTIGDDRW